MRGAARQRTLAAGVHNGGSGPAAMGYYGHSELEEGLF